MQAWRVLTLKAPNISFVLIHEYIERGLVFSIYIVKWAGDGGANIAKPL